jgi:dipeptidyl aminopeptidase/acylaminoacyl peptidase
LSGRPVPIALDVGTYSLQRSFFTASPRVLITAPAVSRNYQLRWFPLAGGKDTPIGEPGDYWQVRLSPDDRFAALTQTTILLGTLDVAVMPVVEGSGFAEQLTRAVAPDSDPVWSSDGQVIAFRSLQDGPPRLYTHLAHFHGAEDVIVPKSTTDETPTDWRDDRIVVRAPGAKGNLDLWTVNARTGAREAIASTGFNESDGRISPDGRWLAYVSDESGGADIYAVPWPRGQRVRVSFAGGTRPRWARNGRAVFFLRGRQIMRADVSASGFTTPRAVLDVGSIRDFDVAHTGDTLLALVPDPFFTAAASSVMVDWRSLVK